MSIRCGSHRLAAILTLLLALGHVALAQTPRTPTPEEYVNYVGEGAFIVPPGQFKLDGYRLYCGTRPTVVDNKLDDYGAAAVFSSCA